MMTLPLFIKIFLILKEEKEISYENFLRMIKAYDYASRELLSDEGDLFLTVDSFITINNIITNSRNLHLRQVNVKPAGYERQYMHFENIKSELYILVDKFNDRFISKKYFFEKFLYEIHPFLDGNGRLIKLCFIL